MDSKETKNTLPLPVKEIVRHMRKSLGSTTARNRRLSDICPLTSRQENDPSHSPKPALTPGIHNSTRTFSPSSLVSCSTLSKLTNSTNMDVIVPRGNCSVHIVSSPPVSFHEQERSAVVRFCGNSQFASTSVNSVSDTSGLDDRIEGSSLMTFRTPNLFNSAQQTADSTSAKFSAAAKLEHDNCIPSKHSTRIELHTEPAISSSNVLVPHESDNQHHFPICHGVSDFSKQTAITSTISATGSAAGSSQTLRHVDTVVPSQHVSQKQPAVTTNQCENSASLRIHFPQRLCRPQIGVAAVIKSTAFSKKANDGPETIQFQSPELYKLVSITSPQTQPGDISSTRVSSDRKHAAKQISTSGNQVVPSSDATTLMPSSSAILRTNVSISHLRTVSSETLAMEESTDDKWKDVKNFMHSPEYEPSTKRRKRNDSGSSEQMSDDDDDVSSSYGDKDDDSDDDYSDIDADLADIKPSECESLVALGKKQKQYFWQYNVQSKGPKGTRLKLAVESPRDPHVLNDFEDPVFDECNTAIAGIRHGGKARKGDGNEITPNPRKLFMIGHQLMRLNHQINACQLGTDVPVTKRTESRKEKNKLASRACRLKKKAQHEANKVKLYGLEQEHSQLNSVLQFIWPQIYKKAKSIIANIDRLPSLSSTSTSLTSLLEAQINQNLKSMVAGHTVEYVNSVILNVESGDYSGGLNIRRSHKTRISSLV